MPKCHINLYDICHTLELGAAPAPHTYLEFRFHWYIKTPERTETDMKNDRNGLEIDRNGLEINRNGLEINRNGL